MQRILIILILLTLISCKTTDIVQTYPAPDLDEKEIRNIESELIDYKRKMLYDEKEKALDHIDNILDIDSTHPVAFYERSKYYYEKEELDKAYQDINVAIKREPQKDIYQKFRVLITQSAGKTGITAKLYNDLLIKFPEDQELWFNAADFYLSSKLYKQALDLLNRYENKFGFNNQILVNKYKLLVQLEKTDQLEEELTKYTEKYPGNIRVLELLGEYYFSTNKVQKGVDIYNEILSKEPENTVALLAMADYYRSNLEHAKSFRYVEKVIDSKDLEVEKKIEIFLRFTQIAQQDEQLTYYYKTLIESLVSQYPNHSDIQLLYGNLLIQEEKFEEAQTEFAKALQSSPDNLKAWVQLIMIDNELKDNDKIIQHSTSALEYFPNQGELYYYRGLAYMLQEKYENATKDLEFGNKITGKTDPLKFQFLYFLGETYYNLDSIEVAFNYFEEAIKIEPNEVSLLNNYAYYLSEHKMKLDRAEEMSKKTIKQEPNNSTYLDTYAWILYQQKKYENALVYIEKSILNGGSNSSVIMEHYGDILYKMGKKEEALTAWEEGSKLEDPTETLLKKVEKGTYVE